MNRTEVIGDATLYLADCRDVLPMVRADHVLTDPPYEAEAHGAGRRLLGRTAELRDSRVREIEAAPLDFCAMDESLREHVCAWAAESCSGWFLAFCQAEAVSTWRGALEVAGAKWRRAMVWVKPDSSPQLSGDRPAQGFESIALAWCGTGSSRWNGGGKRGVFTYGKHDPGMGHGGGANEHPTQKPRLLMAELVALFTNPGEMIADPFMGSGTTGVAAIQAGRRFVGVERNPHHFEVACRRMQQAHDQRPLFAAEPVKVAMQLGLEAA
jgi:site-specific DNA-methyltransferase (adenine-specific)